MTVMWVVCTWMVCDRAIELVTRC